MKYPTAGLEQQRAPRMLGERPGASRPNNYTTQFVVDASGVRRTEAVETDPHRIAQRQKQIDYGKNTLGYARYTEEVPKHLRRKISTTITKHPDTPDVTQICSKRSFDGQAKKWRRELHLWDPQDEEDLLEPVMQTAVQHDAAAEQLGQPDAAQSSLAQQVSALCDAAQQNMAESVESPEASGADPYPYSAPPYLIPHTEDTRPSSFVSPKKQKTDTGHARLLPPRHGGSIVGENVPVFDPPRKPVSTGSKRSYQDMDKEAIGSAQAFQEQTHIKVEAVDVKQEEGASNDIKFEVPTDGVGNTQPDDIFGPAHEFD